MEISFHFAFVFIFLLTLFVHISNSAKTILVDGVSNWSDPNVIAGDTIIFKHRYNYSLYIFRNERAFQHCNFTKAVMLTKPNSNSFTWHPSRPGFFYFSFNDGTAKPCLEGHKLAVKVTLTTPSPSPEPSPEITPITPTPTPGEVVCTTVIYNFGWLLSVGVSHPISHPISSLIINIKLNFRRGKTPGGVVSTPSFPWPFRPHEALSPGLAPLPASPAPENGEGVDGMPFIDSNPSVPLPTGAVDSATIRPVSTSSGAGTTPQVVGISSVYKVVCCVLVMMLI